MRVLVLPILGLVGGFLVWLLARGWKTRMDLLASVFAFSLLGALGGLLESGPVHALALMLIVGVSGAILLLLTGPRSRRGRAISELERRGGDRKEGEPSNGSQDRLTALGTVLVLLLMGQAVVISVLWLSGILNAPAFYALLALFFATLGAVFVIGFWLRRSLHRETRP